MRFRTLIKLVLLISAFSVLAATYGTRVLLYLGSGHGVVDVTCEQKTDQQIAAEGVKADPPEDQKACWSVLTDSRPQILTETPPEAITDTPSGAVTDTPSRAVTATPSEAPQ
jgi:hypothetical protein